MRKSSDATKPLSSLNVIVELFNRLRNYYKKTMQWLVCLLHVNELPLRHLFLHIDGTTAGPKSFLRPIGKFLTVFTEFHITSYQPISLLQPLLCVAVKNLSTVQKYLFQKYQPVSEGHRPCNLALRKLGPLNHLQLPKKFSASTFASMFNPTT